MLSLTSIALRLQSYLAQVSARIVFVTGSTATVMHLAGTGSLSLLAAVHHAIWGKGYIIYRRRSVTVFPKLSDKEVSAIVETRKQYARAFNMSAECLINNGSTSKRFLHKAQLFVEDDLVGEDAFLVLKKEG